MNRRIVLRVSLAVTLPIILAPAYARSADLVAGEALAEKWCAQCHGVRAGEIGANRSAPAFPEVATEPSITEYSLRALLRSPHATMPQIMLAPDQIDDIVGYILSLKPKH